MKITTKKEYRKAENEFSRLFAKRYNGGLTAAENARYWALWHAVNDYQASVDFFAALAAGDYRTL